MKYLAILLIFFTGCKTTTHSKNLEDIKNIYNSLLIATQVEYKNDIDTFYVEDHWQTPIETQELNTGDCEDKSYYLKYMLWKHGIYSKVVVGIIEDKSEKEYLKEMNSGEPIHAWVEVDVNGITHIMDPTCGLFKKKTKTFNVLEHKRYRDRSIGKFQSYIWVLEFNDLHGFAKEVKKDLK